MCRIFNLPSLATFSWNNWISFQTLLQYLSSCWSKAIFSSELPSSSFSQISTRTYIPCLHYSFRNATGIIILWIRGRGTHLWCWSDCCILTWQYCSDNSWELGGTITAANNCSTQSTSELLQPTLPHALPFPQATLHCIKLMWATVCMVDARRTAVPSLIRALCHVLTLSRWMGYMQ